MGYLVNILYVMLVINAMTRCHASSIQRSDQRCDLAVTSRQDCADGPDMTEVSCVNRGCCWRPCINCHQSIPWCYLSSYMLTEECEVNDAGDKVDCGYDGIRQDECLIQGCCWKPSPIAGQPWCYMNSPGEAIRPTVKPAPPSLVPGTEDEPAPEVGVFVEPGAAGGGMEYHWQEVQDGNLPSTDNMVIVRDNTNKSYMVGRVTKYGQVIPAKIHPANQRAYYAYNDRESWVRDHYEVLIIDSGSTVWVDESSGSVSPGAIIGGHGSGETEASHPYYIATAITREGPHIGYLDPTRSCALIPWGHRVYCESSYKILAGQ